MPEVFITSQKYNDTVPEPLYLSSGELLTPMDVRGSRYAFQFVPFGGITVLQPPDNVDFNTLLNNPERYFPKNIDRAICFYPVGSLIESFLNEDETASSVEMENVNNMDSGFISPTGTLMPQFIYSWDYGRNRLILSENENKDTSEEQPVDIDKEFKWYCQPITVDLSDSQENNDEIKAEIEELLKNKSLWAYEQIIPNSQDSSVINLTGRHKLIDRNSYQRSFISHFPTCGAFAFLMDIRNANQSQEDKNPAYFKLEIGKNADSITEAVTDLDSDNIEITVRPNTNAIVTIMPSDGKKSNSASEPLVFSNHGMKIIHVNYLANAEKHIFFCYPLLNSLILTGDLVTSNEQMGKNIVCKKDSDIDINTKTVPKLSLFPTEHKKHGTDTIWVGNDNSYVQLGHKAKVIWNQCEGTFGFTPLFFSPVVAFSFFFSADGAKVEENERQGELDVYVCLEAGDSHGRYKGISGVKRAKRILFDPATKASIYRVDFLISTEGSFEDLQENTFEKKRVHLNRFPFELFGMTVITKVSGKLNDIMNNDGDFGKDFEEINPLSERLEDIFLPAKFGDGQDSGNSTTSWTDFITNASISHNLDGTTGSLTLDKFAATDEIMRKTAQCIGAITLIANNGFYSKEKSQIGTMVDDTTYLYNHADVYDDEPWGLVFKGYGMEISDTAAENSTTHSVSLIGIQKKLSDMKLINCPFWDGDAVFDPEIDDNVLNYFRSYTGCDLRYVPAFSRDAGDTEDPIVTEIILPRSSDWAAPAVNFQMGTTCLDALKEIAKFINHQFIIQPNGKGYFYKMDEYGAPTWITNGPIVLTLNEHDIFSFSIKPYLENRYNTFLTLGLLVKPGAKGVNGLGNALNETDGAKPGMVLTQDVKGFGNFPWSKVIVNHQQGYVTKQQLEKFHETNVKFSISDMYVGQIEIPGFHGLFLFDKIQINCDNGVGLVYYVHGISHNFDLTSKDWTTSLEIASFDVTSESVKKRDLI